MKIEYKVKTYAPKVKGCGATDMGWNETRCQDFQEFLNNESTDGWKLHSYDYRAVTVKGCGGNTGSWLVCVFKKMG